MEEFEKRTKISPREFFEKKLGFHNESIFSKLLLRTGPKIP
jgi:hypothetical protein